ncbi:Uncharacterised protein [Vibrio cholerae]|uniref:Uncharacterized protein n=1 Tax=Vibrio cholerae TaxID=666 RepID=A0A655XS67_VIBCL|nr:Uncharacterised protein [Vibrio cholerae]CSC13034.1 Uncharacterised protein [Vibrio cholerae]CSC21159.1 Uncharacterised protein [Vibrio cholerae]CSC37488.1 Uncharacterised protein [Vibrio cholerae]CSD28859.1 Uncharacterised protein [Vibrio cholerae]
MSHTKNHTISEEGIKPHTWRLSDRIIGNKTHNETANRGRQTGRHENRTAIHSRIRQNGWVNKNNVSHGQESRDPSEDLSAHVRAVFTEFKKLFQHVRIL